MKGLKKVIREELDEKYPLDALLIDWFELSDSSNQDDNSLAEELNEDDFESLKDDLEDRYYHLIHLKYELEEEQKENSKYICPFCGFMNDSNSFTYVMEKTSTPIVYCESGALCDAIYVKREEKWFRPFKESN